MRIFVKLNERFETKRGQVFVKLARETEKAYLLQGTRTITRRSGRVREYEIEEWIPKSASKLLPGHLFVAEWVPREKDIPALRFVVTLNDRELREKTGLELLTLTPEELLILKEKGYTNTNEV